MSFQCIDSLEENPKDLFLMVSSILLKLIDNVLMYPHEPKYRKIRLENVSIKKHVLPAIGGMECLFEIGFQEGDDSLILPQNVSVEKLKIFQREIQKRRTRVLNQKSPGPPCDTSSNNRQTVRTASRNSNSTSSNSYALPSSSSITDAQIQKDLHKVNLFKKLEDSSERILEYENKQLQEKALSVIPLSRLHHELEVQMRSAQNAHIKSNSDEKLCEASLQQIIFFELLMKWFKIEFFSWVDTPRCHFCQSKSTKFMNYSNDAKELASYKTERIEVYQCEICANRVLFPRFNSGFQLLNSRQGRCGEWAQCFTLLCRALGYDARLVIDWTDHVWTEVYLDCERRWMHCDPCECVLDSPLLYEQGWKKNLSYVIAFSRDEVQDVTWRYSADYAAVVSRRTECAEPELLQEIKRLTDIRRANVSQARLKYLVRRQVLELAEFLAPAKPKPGEKFGGRMSGSLAWRLARGETKTNAEGSSEPYVWGLTPQEASSKVMIVSYDCAKDEYSRGSDTKKLSKFLSGWQNGLFHLEDVFRKEELDWKTVYLCRSEKSEIGRLSWKFDIQSSGLVIDTVHIICSSKTFKANASVEVTLCGKEKCVPIELGEKGYKTDALGGETELSLKVELKGGEGDLYWQHAQLFRQPLVKDDNSDALLPPFSVTITMKEKL